MKVTAFLLAAACFALASAGPNPYRLSSFVQGLESAMKQRDAEANVESAVEAQQSLDGIDHGSGSVTELLYYQPGKTIYIYGKAPASGSFNIDLIPEYYGAYSDDVIALRLTIDVDLYKVVRNSFAYSQWLYEENEGYSGIQPRRSFAIVITLQHYSYEIAIDGYHFATYYHRVPYTKNMQVVIDESIYADPVEYH